ncbi:hypothetical protein B0H13DRAFT_2185109 [Mycena leptocephala]|nr:hypothetical protein B0H13DRAFT_2016680 [Mycena leptocephala]KAJ7923084.1 hypothetical protein B0H13DRAFT_2185109 [Mycena leptocephala]
MGWFDHKHEGHDLSEPEAYAAVTDSSHPEHHKAKTSHELIAAAASFEAAKAYEKHCEENGKPASHALAKELLAGFAGAFVDRMVESKGLDAVEAQKAKHNANKHVEKKLDDYGDY